MSSRGVSSEVSSQPILPPSSRVWNNLSRTPVAVGLKEGAPSFQQRARQTLSPARAGIRGSTDEPRQKGKTHHRRR